MEEDDGGELVSLASSLSLERSNFAPTTGEVINPELDPNAPALVESNNNNPEDELEEASENDSILQERSTLVIE